MLWHVPILMYHRVTSANGSANARYAIPLGRFEWQISWLKEHGYQTVSLTEVADWTEGRGHLPARPIAITFDDGFLDTYQVAIPILDRHQFTATIFLTLDYVGGCSEWDAGTREPVAPLMSWEQAEELALRGFAIGAHTRRHVDLTLMDLANVREELAYSRRLLRSRIPQSDPLLAYPFNRTNGKVMAAAAAAGFVAACAGGFLGYSRYCLDRSDPTHAEGLLWLLQVSGWMYAAGTFPPLRLLRYIRRKARNQIGK
jgi:peptidoglycan/xylan/chitin deacetylase (PgdA/CDA1 family)